MTEMATGIVRPRYIEPDKIEPIAGTLLDLAKIEETLEWLHEGAALFESYNCIPMEGIADWCGPNSKEFDYQGSWVDGDRFAVYGGVTCNAIGGEWEGIQTKAEAAWRSREHIGVEVAAMTHLAVHPDTEDLTPAGGPVSPKTALALLEGHAARFYAGVPTIHTPRLVASLLSQDKTIELEGRRLKSALGSKLAAGGGYDYPNLGTDGEEAEAGTKWLYGSGEVVLARTPEIRVREMDRGTNEVVLMLERGYVIAVDCYRTAIQVEVPA